MQSSTRANESQSGPRRRGRHHRYDESLDEAPRLLDDEPADVEQADPHGEENESVEDVEDTEESASRALARGRRVTTSPIMTAAQ